MVVCRGKLSTRKLPILQPASLILRLSALDPIDAMLISFTLVDAGVTAAEVGEVGSVAARARLACRRPYDPGETHPGLELPSALLTSWPRSPERGEEGRR